MLVLFRFSAAMFSNIQDCDEGQRIPLTGTNFLTSDKARSVYNFWEPLHYLEHGFGFQTWETSPDYAIRSWAYILLHLPFSRAATFLAGDSKVSLTRSSSIPAFPFSDMQSDVETVVLRCQSWALL